MTTEEVQRISQQILDRQGFLVVRSSYQKAAGYLAEPRCSEGTTLGAMVAVIEEATEEDFHTQCALAREIIGASYQKPRPRPGCYFYRTIAE